MVDSNLSNGVFPVNPSSLMTIGQASKYCQCHPQTLRGHVRRGKLKAYRIGPTGWLRFSQDELGRLFGIRQERVNTEKKVCIYARVSSDGQADYLKSQIKRLKKYVKENYGEPNPLLFSEIRGAFSSNRTALYTCIDAIIDGKVDILICEYLDRLDRSGMMLKLVKHICKRYGVEIVFVNKSENDPNSIQAGFEELLNYTCHLTARQNGLKSASRNRIDISTDCQKRMYELKKEGLSERGIVKVLAQEGFTNPKTNKPFERATIGRRLRQSWVILEKMYGGKTKQKTSFERFAEKHISKVSVRAGKKRTSKVTRKRIIDVYRQWCLDNNELENGNSHITKTIEGMFKPKKSKYNGTSILYENISLLVSRSR